MTFALAWRNKHRLICISVPLLYLDVSQEGAAS